MPTGGGARPGRRRLAIGGLLGVVGAIVGILLPVVLIAAGSVLPTGSISLGSGSLSGIGLLVAAGLVLLTGSLAAYRSAFSMLRGADPRFWIASVLCLVGSVGLVGLLFVALLVSGTSGSIASCVHGAPTRLLTCLRAGSSGEQAGAGLAVLGFWLAWTGGLGIVVGLGVEGRRVGAPPLLAGAVSYALMLLVLVGPFAGLFLTLPGATELLFLLPVIALLAPALVLAGSLPIRRPRLSR